MHLEWLRIKICLYQIFVAVPTNPHESWNFQLLKSPNQHLEGKKTATDFDMPFGMHWLWKPPASVVHCRSRPKFQWSYHLPNRKHEAKQGENTKLGTLHASLPISTRHTSLADTICLAIRSFGVLKHQSRKGSVCHTEASASCRQRPVLQLFLVLIYPFF